MQNLSTDLRAYLECALWASTGDDDEPLDAAYTLDDFAPEAIDTARTELDDFRAFAEEQIGDDAFAAWSEEQIGHDFFLTRNGHGAGFWDRGLPHGNELTRACKTFGSADPYVGDDGRVYFA